MSRTEITEQTRVSLRTTVAIVSVIVAGVLWQNNKLNVIERGIEQSWKSSDQQLWADRLKTRNPALIVPSVESVRSGVREREVSERNQNLGSTH